MSPHDRLLGIVRSYLTERSATAESCLACLAAAPPEDVPDRPESEVLARAFVRGDTDGLPPGLAAHLADWLSFPADINPFLAAWSSSCSVSEVANRLRTDPDQVLYLADGLRRRGIELPAHPGARWSR